MLLLVKVIESRVRVKKKKWLSSPSEFGRGLDEFLENPDKSAYLSILIHFIMNGRSIFEFPCQKLSQIASRFLARKFKYINCCKMRLF